MKKNQLFMVLTMLFMIPMAMCAKSGLGWLHFGESGTDYYDEKGKPVTVIYNNRSYDAFPIIGMSNVYYVPNEKSSGTKDENLKILYLKGASLTKNIRCTKSSTNLAVVVSGTNSITFKSGSTFKLEKGNLTIVGEKGSSTDKLTLTTSGTYHGAYTPGNITVKNVTLNISCSNSAAALSGESSSSKLLFDNAIVKSNGTLYSGGSIQSTGCGFGENEGGRLVYKDKYMYWKDGSKAKYSPNITNTGVYWTIDTQKSTYPVKAASKVNFDGFDLFGLRNFDQTETGIYGAKLSIPTSLATVTASADGGIFWNASKNTLTFRNVIINTNKGYIFRYFNKSASMNVQIVGSVTLKSNDYAIWCQNGKELIIKKGTENIQHKLIFPNGAANVESSALTVSVYVETSGNANYAFSGKFNSKLCLDSYYGGSMKLNAKTCPIDGFDEVEIKGTYGQMPDVKYGILYDTKNKYFVSRPTYTAAPQPIKKLNLGASGIITLNTKQMLNNEFNKIMIDDVAYIYSDRLAMNYNNLKVYPSTTVQLPFTMLGKKEWATKKNWKRFEINNQSLMCVELDIPSNILTSGKVYWVIEQSKIVLAENAQITTGNKAFVDGGCNWIKVNDMNNRKGYSINSGTSVAINASAGLTFESYNYHQLNITNSARASINVSGDLTLKRVYLNIDQRNASASAIKVSGNLTSNNSHLTIKQSGISSSIYGVECTSRGKLATFTSSVFNGTTRGSSIKGFDNVVSFLPENYIDKDFYYDKTNCKFMIGSKEVNNLNLERSPAEYNYEMDTRINNTKRGNLTVWPVSAVKKTRQMAQ